ncbi:hypothetical protein D3C80_1055650 [compost metagenome]
MHQHRREQAPPLAIGKAGGQRGEVQVVALHAKIEEGQPAQGGEVVAKAGEAGDDQAQQQDRRRCLAGAQLLADARPRRCGQGGVGRQFELGIALGEALVQLAHVFGEVLGHPQHLVAALLADPVRHLQAPQQADKAAEIGTQRHA